MISRSSFLRFFLLLAGFLGGQKAASAAPLQPDPGSKTIRVACVGDSITQGSGAETGRSYPAQLQEMLGNEWHVGNFGVSARTLLRKGDFPYWNEKAFLEAQAFQPHAVIIMLGTNDTKPQNWVHEQEFSGDYADLVKTFFALPSHPRVYVCRPPPVPEPGNYGIDETNIRAEIERVDALAKELQLDVIDMHAALVNRPELLPDRVHPNTEGATLMAAAAFESLTGRKVPAQPFSTNSLFRRDAVLQRDIVHPVWGTAPNDTVVTVDFAGQKVSATARDGKWMVRLQPLAASEEPETMTISSPTEKIVLENILVGDVWLASGQSNMERQLGPRPPQPEIVGAKEEMAAANYPLIRQFYVPQRIYQGRVADVRGSWSVCSPETVKDFTAVGYYFARDLFKKLQIPIGILHSSWGGTPIRAWISPESLKTLPAFRDLAPAFGQSQNAPAALDHSMIAPLLPFPIRGVIWYQGESDSQGPELYRSLFPLLIEDWRQRWNLGAFPFLFVQIAPYRDMTPEIREAQFLTLAKSANTAMAVTTDVGDAADIHPPRKEPIGQRLALAARALAYGEKIEYSGPLYDSMKIEGKEIRLGFQHAGTGLRAEGGALRGFTIAGSDHNFVPAEARIEGDSVVVGSEQVPAPTAVRYGWSNVPDVNLFNAEGLPASPFRTDVE